MAHLSDQELKELKARVISAMGTGASLGHANEHLYALITEVEEHRAGGSKKGSSLGTLKVGEMDVKKAEESSSSPIEDEDKAEKKKSGKKK